MRLRRRLKVRDRIAQYKRSKGCECCGLRDPRVLDLHHANGLEKRLAVSQMLYRSSWETVLTEIEKCSVLCANCHRIEHFEEKITAQIAAAGFYRAS